MKSVPVAAIAMILALTGSAFAAEIADIPWNQANIATLRALNKSEVSALVLDVAEKSGQFVPWPKASEIGDFRWADLAGDGTYQLLLSEDVNGRHFYNALLICNRDSAGKLTYQEIRGWDLGNLEGVVQDLNGDGKDELIIPSQLEADTYRGASGMALWPAVYRLERGHYVEASRDFAKFYSDDALPALNAEIAAARKKANASAQSEHVLAMAVMVRDKVLRVIGRDPTAGERDARRWVKSANPELRMDAAATLGDIGCCKDDLRALSADKDPSVALAAKFAMMHPPGSFARWNRGRRFQTIVNSPR